MASCGATHRRSRFAEKKGALPFACALLLLCAFFVQGFLSLRVEAPTFDEVTYFGLGHYLLETGRFDVPASLTHPPLSFYVSSLPLLARPLERDLWQYPASLRQALGENFLLAHDPRRGQRLFSRDSPPDRSLNRCRTANLALGLLLGPAIFLWARRLFGGGGGLLSLFLFAFDPNLIAHARLITPDFCLTVFFFLAVFFSASRWPAGGFSSLGAAALCTGLALLTKHSALLLLAILPPIFFAAPGGRGRKAAELAILLLLAAAVVCLGYGLKPWLYLESLELQIAHAKAGHRAYLWGEISDRGWWYYYLFAMALKTPLSLLFLLFWALVREARPFLDRRAWLSLFLPPFVIVGAFSLASGPEIGLRYVLPAYPFLIVLAGALWPASRKSGVKQAVLVLALGWQLLAAVRIYPHYLAFFNELAGGPSQGFRYLVDSNLDWGQDLKGLARYLEERGIERVRLSYFGAADPSMYGISYEPLPGYYSGRNLPAPDDWRGVFAISATNLAGVYLRDPDTFAPLRARTPDAVIGYSIFIYDLR